MPVMIDTVSRFSPGNCEPELLESMLVGRHDLATQLEKSVLDSIETHAGHHWLLVGPRGVGKTHLLAILFNRVNARETIRQRVAIAYMKEEERGVASYLDWLVRILRAFERRSEVSPGERPDLDLGQRLEALKRLPLERAAVAAERLLLDFVGERRVLLITENLGELFSETKGMGRVGQQKFRDLLQQYPVWTVIASTQALFEDVQSKEAPFYGFFKVRHLLSLDLEDTVELLSKLAVSERRHELAEFFRSEAGQGRIRAIHEITGGNPRLLVIFYQFVDRETIEDLARPFLEMVDNLTSYYQEQMQPLPALQQKIIEFLCEHRSPATVKEIARSCFISHQTASAQLRRLAERRYVQSTAVGRESYYELREPLFRICFEVKENLGYPIRLFVDFLGKFYSMEELLRRHQAVYLLRSIYETGGRVASATRLSRELVYLEEAITTYHQQASGEFLQQEPQQIRVDYDNITTTIDDLIAHGSYREATKLADAAFEQRLGGTDFLFKSATGHRRLGELSAALERLQQIVEDEPENCQAWVEKGDIELESEDPVAAEASYRQALKLDGDNAKALVGIGIVSKIREDHEEARRWFILATQVAPKNERAWRNLGWVQYILDNVEQARRSLAKATALAHDSIKAWFVRGFLEWKEDKRREARECFERVVTLRPLDEEDWFWYAIAHDQLENLDDARTSFAKVTELDPKNSDAWFYRGDVESRLGDHEAARYCFFQVTRLRPNDADGWSYLARKQEKLGDVESARLSYSKAIELDPENADLWFNHGVFEGNQGDHRTARQCFGQVTRLQPNTAAGWYNLAHAQNHLGDVERARDSYAKATEVGPEDVGPWFYRGIWERDQGDHETARQCFERLTRLRPNDSSCWYSLAYAQDKLGDVKSARDSYAKATEVGPEDVDSWGYRGVWERNQGDHETARQCFEQVTRLRPNDAAGWHNLAWIQDRMGDVESARDSYAKATEAGPENADAWFNRGILAGNQGEHEMARQCFEQVTCLQPDAAGGWHRLALAQDHTGDAESARVSYARATELDPNNASAWFYRGVLATKQEDYEVARECFEHATHLLPDGAGGWHNLAWAQYQVGGVESARASYARACELDRENASTWFYRGILEWEQSDYETAREYFEQATRLRPDDAGGWLILASTQAETGDMEACGRSLARSRELAPEGTHSWLLGAWLEWHKNNREQALDLLKKAEFYAPESADYFDSLADIHRDMGDYEKASEHYCRALELDPLHCLAHFHIALMHFEAGEFDQGLERLISAVKAGRGQDWSEPLPLAITEINTHLLLNAPLYRLEELVRTQREILATKKFGELFAQGLIGALTAVLRCHRDVPRERLIELRDGVLRELGKDEELSVVCRLFSTGVRYLESEDERVLLELPLEERSSLKKLLQAED